MSFTELLKKEIVAFIAAFAAFVSCLLVPVTNYVEYIDTDIIAILFGLMAVVAGFSENNAFKRLSETVIRHAKNTRSLTLSLTLTVFFTSMLITNDVALIAFVPFTMMVWEKIGKSPIYVIVLETIAANLGSTLTPLGNPQNLYLFSTFNIPTSEFFGITLQITGMSLVMLIIASLCAKKEAIDLDRSEPLTEVQNPRYLVLYAALFVLCLLSVFGIVTTIAAFASVCVVAAIMQPVIFSRVDYGLLVTFACFFIFVGNIKNIPEVTKFVADMISDHEFESTLAACQVISNVPSAVMLSAFTDKYRALILGADIGGLGTVIASLASLISYKNYCRSETAQKGKYMLAFTAMNIVFLAVLYCYAKFVIL